MAQEGVQEKKAGMAFDVILAPAAVESVPMRTTSPPKERPISQEFIDKKLKDAEERRLSMETAKLQAILKDKERLQEASQRRQQNPHDSSMKETEEELEKKSTKTPRE